MERLVFNKAQHKLEELEKYGFESFELLEHIIKKGIVINSVIEDFSKEEYDKMKQDRDTWQKACELACEDISTVKIITNENMAESDDLPNYFYQQAKKEGE